MIGGCHDVGTSYNVLHPWESALVCTTKYKDALEEAITSKSNKSVQKPDPQVILDL